MGTCRRVISVLFAGSPVGTLCAQILFLLATDSTVAPASRSALGISLSGLAAAGLIVGMIAFSLHIRGRKLALKRFHGLRLLASMVDELREDIKNIGPYGSTEDGTAKEIGERLKRFIIEALGVIDTSLFPSKKIEMTFMREAAGCLKIIAAYPKGKWHERKLTLGIDPPTGYAGVAYTDGRTVYLPSVGHDWGVRLTLARRAGQLPRRRRPILKDCWVGSDRMDYGSLVCAPAMTVANIDDFRFRSYGVLNIEHTARIFKNAFRVHDLYCACLAAGALGNAIEIAAARLGGGVES